MNDGIYTSAVHGHYSDVIMSSMAFHITSLATVYPTVDSGADQRKHQSSASLAFVWGIHRWPVNSPHKWPVTRKMFPFDDVIMSYGWSVLVEQRICLNKETRFIGVSCFYQWTQFLVCVCCSYGTITKISLYDPYRMPHFPNRPDPTQWNGFPSRCWSGTLAKETEAYTMTKSCASNIISSSTIIDLVSIVWLFVIVVLWGKSPISFLTDMPLLNCDWWTCCGLVSRSDDAGWWNWGTRKCNICLKRLAPMIEG